VTVRNATSDLPLVSVYLPTRNRLERLVRAVASVRAQCYPKLELIVVSDASDDGTADWVRAREREDASIRFIELAEQAGACVARNRAIEAARGTFVTGLDDDDEFLPGRVAALVAAHEERFAFVCTRDRVVRSGHGRVENPSQGTIGLDDLLHYNKVGNQALMLRSRVRELGGFDEALQALQDYDLWVRLVHAYGPCLKLREASYVTHAECDDRISSSPERIRAARVAFIAKHRGLMTQAHIDSMALLEIKLSGRPLRAREFARLSNRGNFVSAAALLWNSNRARVS